jgi:hypothetical protein
MKKHQPTSPLPQQHLPHDVQAVAVSPEQQTPNSAGAVPKSAYLFIFLFHVTFLCHPTFLLN